MGSLLLALASLLGAGAGSPPEEAVLQNQLVRVSVDRRSGAFSLTDLRNRATWVQVAPTKATASEFQTEKLTASFALTVPELPAAVRVTLSLSPTEPTLAVTLKGSGPLPRALEYPYPFQTPAGTYLVLPMNEGIWYPVSDTSIKPRRLIAYGGHGLCMGFWGVTDGQKGILAILRTPDDAAVRLRRAGGLLVAAPQWDPQKGTFGYPRRISFTVLHRGGYVAMCKRYRAYATRTGLLVTLKEKARRNPHVNLLLGAVNVWCWERDPLGIVKELRQAGIERILWSHRERPAVVRTMNGMGILTSRYDIYQDLMDPQIVKKKLRGPHPDWPQEGWPRDLMLDRNGRWRRGWRVRGKDGIMYPCGVLCDRQALAYARKRVPRELAVIPYRCRFIDTTTASPWRECYHPKHPMTRSQSKRWKMELLRFMSSEMHLVTGSETGHEAAVPFVHYFEGMLSLGPYRVPDAGRNMARIWYEVPERVRKFQLGHRYRLPLWELVYHDCVVAQWYWGDYNNKLPALWNKRDLFNVLYGTPPMFMCTRTFLRENRERFAKSYRTTSPVARATAVHEMTDHRFLTKDRAVQQTRFANGVVVTVNFGSTPFRLPDGTQLGPEDYHVEGLSEAR